jgi:membrane protein
MSLVPALVLLTAIMAYLPLPMKTAGASPFISYVVPAQVISLFQDLLSIVSHHRTGLLSFGLIASLWLTSKGFKGVIAGLDIVYNVQEPRPMWTNRILAFGLAFAVGVLLLLGVVLTLVGPTLETLLSRVVPIQSVWLRMWPYVQWFLSALFIFSAIELLYRLAPNIPAKQRLTIPGSLIATAIWLALSWGLGYYFHHFGDLKLDRLYEFLASPIALVVWLYWSAIAILIGAEINVSLQFHKTSKAPVAGSVSQQSDAA